MRAVFPSSNISDGSGWIRPSVAVWKNHTMIDFVLDLLHRWRPSPYRGVGVRGGFFLGILWALVSAVACEVPWNPIGLTLCLLGSAVVGYRLERIGGAIAVVIFSLGFWCAMVFSG